MSSQKPDTSPAENNSIILIGMPAVGKSSLGVLLAKQLAKGFVDTDIRLQEALGMNLQAYVDRDGYEALREQEEAVLLETKDREHVIATGGSAVYSEKAMQHLATLGLIVYLQAPLAAIAKRLQNWSSRGLACAPGTSLEQLYHEREPLYRAFSQLTVPLSSASIETDLRLLLEALRKN